MYLLIIFQHNFIGSTPGFKSSIYLFSYYPFWPANGSYEFIPVRPSVCQSVRDEKFSNVE